MDRDTLFLWRRTYEETGDPKWIALMVVELGGFLDTCRLVKCVGFEWIGELRMPVQTIEEANRLWQLNDLIEEIQIELSHIPGRERTIVSPDRSFKTPE